MTVAHTFQRYESVACMDRQDAEDLNSHLMAIATALATNKRGCMDLATQSLEIGRHVSRLIRIVQRATQPDVVGSCPCNGVERLILTVDDGKRLITVRTPRADIVFDFAGRNRLVSLEERDATVVAMAPYMPRRAA